MPQDLISQFDRKYPLPVETYRKVPNITQRNAIPGPIRWEGMIVYVDSEAKSYVLTGGTDNTKWEDLGTLVNVNVVDNLLSTSPSDALSANQGRVLEQSKLSDAPIDGSTYGRKDGAWEIIVASGGTWGSITGTLSAQTDLQSALDAKAMDSSVVHKTGTETITGDKNFNNSYTRFNVVVVGGNGPEPYISLDKRSDDSHVTNSFGIFAFNNSGNLVIGTPQDPPGGFTNLNYVFDSLGLSSDRTYILPDANGTVALQTAASGSFTTTDSKTVTVVNGIITSIV